MRQVRDRLHLLRVEGLAHAVERLRAVVLQGLQERVVDELDALDERVVGLLLRVRERELEVVHRRKDVLEDVRLGVAVGVLAVARGALLVVVEVGEREGVERLPVGLLRRLRRGGGLLGRGLLFGGVRGVRGVRDVRLADGVRGDRARVAHAAFGRARRRGDVRGVGGVRDVRLLRRVVFFLIFFSHYYSPWLFANSLISPLTA